MVKLKLELAWPHRKKLEAALKKFAFGHARWTLPAIVMRDASGIERVLTLPTLNISFPYLGMQIKWDIRYKKVDIGRLICFSETSLLEH